MSGAQMSNKIDMSLDEIIAITKPSASGSGGGFRMPGQRNRYPCGDYNDNLLRKPNYMDDGDDMFGTDSDVSREIHIGQKFQRIEPVNDATMQRRPSAFHRCGNVLATNLAATVSEKDLRELFAEFGTIMSVTKHYNACGVDLGMADLVFERRDDAFRAISRYNGVPLDNQPMGLQLINVTEIEVKNREADVSRQKSILEGTNRFDGRGSTARQNIVITAKTNRLKGQVRHLSNRVSDIHIE